MCTDCLVLIQPLGYGSPLSNRRLAKKKVMGERTLQVIPRVMLYVKFEVIIQLSIESSIG